MKIIIMDHDKITKDNLCGYLGISGQSWKCCECKDKKVSCTEEALRLISTYNPDVVVIECKMPNTNGIDLLKIIKNEYPQIKVLFLTEHANTECAMNAVNFGADGFFIKNLHNIKFAKKIREIDKVISS